MTAAPLRVAIVGAGPKGTYALERLIAELAQPAHRAQVHIDVIERSGMPGSGPVYDPAQPGYLLANVPAGSINAWATATPGYAPVRVAVPQTLCGWSGRQLPLSTADAVPRAVVGRYLQAAFAQVLDSVPSGVTVAVHHAEVEDVGPGPRRAVMVRGSEGTRTLDGPHDHVLLATGHPTLEPSPEQAAWRRVAANDDGAVHVPHAYPVDEMLAKLPRGQPVGVVGLGLTFTDVALACSEGRGGRFRRRAGRTGGLDYEPSGHEPVLVPLSRSGLPMLPRPLDRSDDAPLVHCTPAALAAVRARAPDAKVDIDADLMPLLHAELVWAHARVLLGLDADDPPSASELRSLLLAHHDRHPGTRPFRPSDLLDPFGEDPPRTPASYERRTRRWLADALVEARRGEQESPLLAAAAVWRSASDVFRAALADGGATPESHHRFLSVHHPRLARVAFGPPIASGEKLLGLIDAGLITMTLGPGGRAEAERGGYLLTSSVTGAQQHVQALVDARIVPTDVRRDASPLIRHLRERGELTTHIVRGRDQEPFTPGGVALVAGSGQLLDRDGLPVRGLFATGTPTEGARYDNDALNRSRNDVASGWAAQVAQDAARLATPVKVGAT